MADPEGWDLGYDSLYCKHQPIKLSQNDIVSNNLFDNQHKDNQYNTVSDMVFALNANITIVPAAYKPSGTFFRINSLNPNYNGPLHKALCGPTVD